MGLEDYYEETATEKQHSVLTADTVAKVLSKSVKEIRNTSQVVELHGVEDGVLVSLTCRKTDKQPRQREIQQVTMERLREKIEVYKWLQNLSLPSSLRLKRWNRSVLMTRMTASVSREMEFICISDTSDTECAPEVAIVEPDKVWELDPSKTWLICPFTDCQVKLKITKIISHISVSHTNSRLALSCARCPKTRPKISYEMIGVHMIYLSHVRVPNRK